jgi:hypothetical protein
MTISSGQQSLQRASLVDIDPQNTMTEDLVILAFKH